MYLISLAPYAVMGLTETLLCCIVIPTVVLQGVYLMSWTPYPVMGLAEVLPCFTAIPTAVLLGLYIVSWTPYAVMGLTEALTGQKVVGPVLETFPALIAKMSAIWDPIVYIATNLQVGFMHPIIRVVVVVVVVVKEDFCS